MSETLHQQQSGMSAFFMEILLPSIRNRTIGDTSSACQPWEMV